MARGQLNDDELLETPEELDKPTEEVKRTLVKLDNKIFEIAEDPKKGGYRARVLPDDELFEIEALDSGVSSFLANDFHEIANKALNELRESLKQNIKNTTFAAIGFEPGYSGGWRVDHCNGRMSAINDYITGETQQMLQEAMNEFVRSNKEQVMKEVGAAIQAEFKENFFREVKWKAREYAAKAAVEFLNGMVKTEITKLQKEAVAAAKSSLLTQSIVKKQSHLEYVRDLERQLANKPKKRTKKVAAPIVNNDDDIA